MAPLNLFLIVPSHAQLLACRSPTPGANADSSRLLDTGPIGGVALRVIPGLGEDPNSLDALQVSPVPIDEVLPFADASGARRVLIVRDNPGNLARTPLILGPVRTWRTVESRSGPPSCREAPDPEVSRWFFEIPARSLSDRDSGLGGGATIFLRSNSSLVPETKRPA